MRVPRPPAETGADEETVKGEKGMTKRIWRRTGALGLALALCAMGTVAQAGKGNGKGGGGGGGNVTPAYELVTLTQVEQTHYWGGCTNCADVVGVNVDGSAFVQLTDDEPLLYDRLAFDARGEVIVFDDKDAGLEVLSPETGERFGLGFGGGDFALTRRLHPATGDVRPWEQQYVVISSPSPAEDPNPRGSVPTIWNAVVVSADGNTSWDLTDFTGSWDASTSTYSWANVRGLMYVPEQHGNPSLAGRAWVFYFLRYEDWYYDAAADTYELIPSSVVTDWHRITLDTTSWDTTGPEVLADVVVDVPPGDGVWEPNGPAGYARISPDGRRATMNREGAPYVVDLDFTTDPDGPVIPEPTAADQLPVTPPSGWDPEVEVRAVSEDGSTVALNIWRTERVGKGKSAGTIRRRHLFVAGRNGSGLTQVDAEPVDFDIRGDVWDIDFTNAVFRPTAD